MAADSAPSSMEANLAMKAVHAISERGMGGTKDPLPFSEANLAAGLKTYRIVSFATARRTASFQMRLPASTFRLPNLQPLERKTIPKMEWLNYLSIKPGQVQNMDHLPKQIADEWTATPSVGDVRNRTMPKVSMKKCVARRRGITRSKPV